MGSERLFLQESFLCPTAAVRMPTGGRTAEGRSSRPKREVEDNLQKQQ